jgi:Secretion system C-terminal sorting domain
MKHLYFFGRNALFCFCIFAFICKASGNNDPIRSNWSNKMSATTNGDMCVEVDENQMLHINLYVYLASNDIELYPDMRIKYKITTPSHQMEVMTEPLAKAMFIPYTTPEGIPMYRAGLKLDYDCIKDCSMVGAANDHFDFTIQFNLVKAAPDNTFEPYPYQMYPALWPDAIFDLPSPDMEYYTEVKHICCLQSQDGLMADEGPYKMMYGQNDDAANSRSKQQNYNKLTATPNPFSNDITIQYNALKSSTSSITCYDVQGRLVKTIDVTAMHDGVQSYSMDLSECRAGLYFVKLSNGREVQVVKVMKM